MAGTELLTSSVAASMAASPGDLKTFRLRALCRTRLLECIVRKVLAPAQSDGSSRRPYMVIVVDEMTLRVVQAICQISDLLEEGICLLEVLESKRQALPTLDALYFITPTAESVKRLIEDAASGASNNLHVFFSHKLSDALLHQVANSKEAVSRIRTFAETNLSLLVYDERSFHLGDPQPLPGLLPGSSGSALDLSEAACRLSSLFMVLGMEPKVFFSTRSTGADERSRAPGVAERLAKELWLNLDDIEARGGATWAPQEKFADQRKPAQGCQLLIVDRSVDWVPLLLHDLHYEAVLYDLLWDSGANISEGKFTAVDKLSSKEVTVTAALNEKDFYFEKYRHWPLWEVNDDIAVEVASWGKRDEEIRQRTAGGASASTMSAMVSSTMAALHSLPEHKERFKKLQVHSDVCERCFQAVQAQQLVELAAFEQELATGVAETGANLVPRNTETNLLKYLKDTSLPPQIKQRLLLLYLGSCDSGGAMCSSERRKELAALLGRGHGSPLLSGDKGGLLGRWAEEARRPETKELAARRQQLIREKIRGMATAASSFGSVTGSISGGGSGAQSPRSIRLRRWDPRLLELFADMVKGTLDQTEFKECRREGPKPPQSPPAGQPRPGAAFAIFVIGGITASEVRIVHEVSQKLKIDAYLGGSCMLTPASLVTATACQQD